jgi:hypothetical protein
VLDERINDFEAKLMNSNVKELFVVKKIILIIFSSRRIFSSTKQKLRKMQRNNEVRKNDERIFIN